MKKINETITINAPIEKVYETMIGENTYPVWTTPFSPDGSSSRIEGSWDEGSEIRFLGKDPETGKEMGMFAKIAINRPNEFISIEHRGIIVDGEIDTTSEQAKSWTPAYENYTFTEKDGGTELSIEMDIEEEYEEMFKEMWPKALQELKQLCEQ